MSIRFITRQIHALIDYPVAMSLIGPPFLLGMGLGFNNTDRFTFGAMPER